MEEKIAKIIALTVTLITLSFSLFFILNPKKDFSENENRYLEKLPTYSFDSLKSGRYMNGISNYLADHFPLRDLLMGIKTSTYKVMGKTKINSVYMGKDNYLLEEYTKPINSDKIINTINNFSKNKNINIEMLLSPTSTYINRNKLPKYAVNASEIEAINYYYSKLNIKTIDVTNILEEKNKTYQMFYYLDHHWTTYGAYFAYYTYSHSNNIKPIAMEEFDIKKVSTSFNGTLYSKTNDYLRKSDNIYRFDLNNSDYVVNYVDTKKTTDTLYNDEYLNKKDKYSYFLDNNHPLITIKNKKIKDNKNILIIKDSYANAFIPFIVNHYEDTYVIDPRYYKNNISEFIKQNNIQNVLFLYNIFTIDKDLGILSIK